MDPNALLYRADGLCELCSSRDLLIRFTKIAMPKIDSITATATPTPTPALAPMERPLDNECNVGLVVDVAVAIVALDRAATDDSYAFRADGERIGAEAGVNSGRSSEAHCTLICGRTAAKVPILVDLSATYLPLATDAQ